MNPAILALSIGAFCIGVTEFAPMSMLPVIASHLSVSIPVAGLLVSAYAMGVVIGAPLITLTTAHWSRRTLLVVLMGIFTAGNSLAAVSSSYAMLLAARILTSLSHGAYFGVGSVVAASLVSVERRAAAVAAMFTGLTFASVVGVPVSAWAAEKFGWQSVFAGIGGLGAIAMASVWFALPDIASPDEPSVAQELRVLARKPVLAALALTVIGSGAMFTVFTYITPILHTQAQASTGFVSAVLVVFGLGMMLGNWVGGRSADKSVDATLLVTLAGLTFLLLLFAIGMKWPWPTVVLMFLWGVATFALIPPLQMRVMTQAADAPNLASAMNIGAFNLGNALGAAIGGSVIGEGWGYPAVSVAGAAMAAAAFIIVLAMRSASAVKSLLPLKASSKMPAGSAEEAPANDC